MLQLIRKSKLFNRTLCLGQYDLRRYNDIPFEDIPEVSPRLIKRTLKAHNLNFQEGHTCFITSCPMCKKKPNAQTVYINKTTGVFMCSSCKQNGTWDYIDTQFSTKKRRCKNELAECTEAQNLEEALTQIRKTTDIISEERLKGVLKKWKLPEVVLPPSLELRIDKKENELYFPLENVESEIVGFRKVSSKSDTIVPNIVYGGLLTARPPKSKDLAVLVPSIADFLVLASAKVSSNVVCLPNGINNLSQYVLPSLERFKKLILWFGNDITSWNSARQFAKKLGEKRCLFVRPSEKNPVPHLVPNQDFKSVIGSAQPIWHKSITTFASLKNDVLSDLQNTDKFQGVKWKRYPTLSKILKGHRRGELTVVTGPTGSGKTTFISEYSLDLAMQGVNTLWGSFEIRNVRLARTMLQQLAGMPLEENLHLFDTWAEAFEKLPIYYMTFHGQQSIKIVMEAVEHATYVHDIAHVIIDNVQFMMGVTEEQRQMDRFLKQDTIIAAFRDFATRKDCHVTLVIHPRKEKDGEDLTTSSIFGGAKASQEADNILIIQDKRLTSARGRKYLQVTKNRHCGDLGVMPLDFNKNALSFAQQRKKRPTEDQEKTKTSEVQ